MFRPETVDLTSMQSDSTSPSDASESDKTPSTINERPTAEREPRFRLPPRFRSLKEDDRDDALVATDFVKTNGDTKAVFLGESQFHQKGAQKNQPISSHQPSFPRRSTWSSWTSAAPGQSSGDTRWCRHYRTESDGTVVSRESSSKSFSAVYSQDFELPRSASVTEAEYQAFHRQFAQGSGQNQRKADVSALQKQVSTLPLSVSATEAEYQAFRRQFAQGNRQNQPNAALPDLPKQGSTFVQSTAALQAAKRATLSTTSAVVSHFRGSRPGFQASVPLQQHSRASVPVAHSQRIDQMKQITVTSCPKRVAPLANYNVRNQRAGTGVNHFVLECHNLRAIPVGAIPVGAPSFNPHQSNGFEQRRVPPPAMSHQAPRRQNPAGIPSSNNNQMIVSRWSSGPSGPTRFNDGGQHRLPQNGGDLRFYNAATKRLSQNWRESTGVTSRQTPIVFSASSTKTTWKKHGASTSENVHQATVNVPQGVAGREIATPQGLKRLSSPKQQESAYKKVKGFDKLDLLCTATLEIGKMHDNPTGCSCPKSKCVALYCDCFKAGRRCSPKNCTCTDCKNTIAESGVEGARTHAIRCILARNPRAFNTAGVGNPTLKLPPGEVACNCIRSRCLKLYCSCFQNGKACRPDVCTCIDCSNTEVDPEGHRKAAIKQAIEKRADAFVVKAKEKGLGCACKNNRCVRKYCECFRTGLGCTDKCTCRECENKGTMSV